MKAVTVYSPYKVGNNLYADNIKRIIKSNGYEIYPIKNVLVDPNLFRKCKIINFNWFENIENKWQYYLKTLLISVLTLSHIKIIYTIHNRQPHNLKNQKTTQRMMKRLCRISDAIIGMCPDTVEVLRELCPSAESKLKIIPHPNYISNYSGITGNLRSKFGIGKDELVYMFFGSVAPYKNIELIIDQFLKLNKAHTRLLVVGKAISEEYKNSLLNRTKESQTIVFDLKYIPDDMIQLYYNTADVIVLPYDKKSSLNSGAVYLSFSLSKTVICPDIGTINALKTKEFVYTYSYKSDQEHPKRLYQSMCKVYTDYCKDNNTLDLKGRTAYEYVKKEHSDQMIEKMYDDLYSALL